MKPITVGLVGNPNCGKTTLFNALTGSRQKIGNWPGVTVERKSGYFSFQETQVQVVDLPGIYSLTTLSETQSLDERIACDYILRGFPDLLINIIDAVNLERNLFLTLQLLQMGVPIIVAVNMLDLAAKRDLEIDLEKLANELNCTVIGIIANKGHGIKDLKKQMNINVQSRSLNIEFPDIFHQALDELSQQIQQQHPELAHSAFWLSQQLLQGDIFARQWINQDILLQSEHLRKTIEENLGEETDILFADILYGFANQICQRATHQLSRKITVTEKIDRIVLNRFLGIPIFLMIMYSMFLFAINLGGAFKDFFDISSDTIFVQGFTELLRYWQLPNWVIAIFAFGAGKGINTIMSFIPIIGGMFLFLSFLETSGYMARAAFVVDRFMRAIGLPGKSFVPMIVGFGCNVPAIMAARTLENPRDRILTIMMSPFMSCGARLAIYAVFTTAFFPNGGHNIVFALYFTGILIAIITGLLLRKTFLQGKTHPFVMELPPYHLPTPRALLLQTWHRLKDFVFRAGKLIVPVCIVIGGLNNISVNGQSLLAIAGRTVTPIFAPIGIKEDNWPATVGLITGVLAKEVVVGTLNSLYMQEIGLKNAPNPTFKFKEGMKEALFSINNNFKTFNQSLSNPIIASIPDHNINNGVYGVMYERFGSQISAFAYLLFVLLYFPCVSATAAMVKELNLRWGIFSVLWTTGIAYCVAVLFYQLATLNEHIMTSLQWFMMIFSSLGFTLYAMNRYAKKTTEVE